MLNWNQIETVLLDMDGTLLDLHFDNYFWLHHVPRRYAEKHDLEVNAAKETLFPLFRSVEGTIEWYCVDYWSETLGLDIAELKSEIEHLIAIHPDVVPFLSRLRESGKRAVLVTNAHQKSLTLKMNRTGLDQHLDLIVCSHDFGVPKEDTDFWRKLDQQIRFDRQRTLLIDDSLAVLRSAQRFGIKHLLAVFKPDSKDGVRDVAEFTAFHHFREIMPEIGTTAHKT